MVNPYQNNFYNPQPTYPQQFYSPYMQQQRYQQQGQMEQQTQQPIIPQQLVQRGLNGMVVMSADKITADCVPMDGSAAFFPKQDLSEIYVKNWCADGTIRTLIFKPTEITGNTNKIDSGLSDNVTAVFEQRFDELFGKIEQLEQTITNSMTKKPTSTTKKAGETG